MLLEVAILTLQCCRELRAEVLCDRRHMHCFPNYCFKLLRHWDDMASASACFCMGPWPRHEMLAKLLQQHDRNHSKEAAMRMTQVLCGTSGAFFSGLLSCVHSGTAGSSETQKARDQLCPPPHVFRSRSPLVLVLVLDGS